MPKNTSKAINKKTVGLFGIKDSQLDLLQYYSDEALGKIWNRSRDILTERNRNRGLKGKNGDAIYLGPKVSCIQLEKVALANINAYNKRRTQMSFEPIAKVQCYGECYFNCIFGVEDIEGEWHCIFPQSRLKFKSRPEETNGRNKIRKR